MLIKALLPLIAAMKYKHQGQQNGWYLGTNVAAAYKGCKEELNQDTLAKPAKADCSQP